jgi:hypothetical protein
MRMERDYWFEIVCGFALIMSAVLAASFWQLGHRSAVAAARWLFVWLWTLAMPAFLALRLRRHLASQIDRGSPRDNDTLHTVDWQILMAGCFAALGIVSLLRHYLSP